MWILQKQLLIDGLTVYAYYSETSTADLNRDLLAAKTFDTIADATEYQTTRGLQGWQPVRNAQPGASEPWELEK